MLDGPDSAGQVGIAPPNLVLLGTHSTIYPWYPPRFGVPIDFLRTLANRLENLLVDVLKEKGLRSDWGRSGQTSARSSLDVPRPVPVGVSQLRDILQQTARMFHSL